ncbi:hypothetical protein ASZ90_010957 [hydrocarbon metagenome]|uniref:Uncharacterized protein n=1 Tax=hydrocarbon metagenome TaxID=938273 RepID=A0A0W8FEM2_9ZZZZ
MSFHRLFPWPAGFHTRFRTREAMPGQQPWPDAAPDPACVADIR